MKLTRRQLSRIIRESLEGAVRAEHDAYRAETYPEENIFQKIRAHKMHGAPMPNIDIDSLASAMNKSQCYDVDRQAFTPTVYREFDDWFLRSLTDDTLRSCQRNAMSADVCSPAQGTIRKRVPAGEMTLKKSVIAVESLLDILEGSDLIQISLRKTDYHHVHSPVDGRVSDIMSVDKDDLFPGSEAMVIVEIETSMGVIKVMCIGEWSVQTFVPVVSVGDSVSKLDELGYFYFGSQVIIVLPPSVEVTVDREQEPRVFPGDPICARF